MVVSFVLMSVACVKLGSVGPTLDPMEPPSEVPKKLAHLEKIVATSEQKPRESYDSILNRFTVGGQIPFPGTSDHYTVEQIVIIRMTEEGPSEELMYIVRQSGLELFRVTPNCDYDWETEKRSCTHEISELDFYTKGVLEFDGIGVGSTLEEFVQVFPEYRLWSTYISDQYVVETEGIKAQFILDKEGVIGTVDYNSDSTDLTLSDFKDGTQIISIRIFQP